MVVWFHNTKVIRINHLRDVIRALLRQSGGLHRAYSRWQPGHNRQLDKPDSARSHNEPHVAILWNKPQLQVESPTPSR